MKEYELEKIKNIFLKYKSHESTKVPPLPAAYISTSLLLSQFIALKLLPLQLLRLPHGPVDLPPSLLSAPYALYGHLSFVAPAFVFLHGSALNALRD
jgi:hypothetical protein